MNISMIGIDHNMAPVDIRALFAFTKKNAGEAMEQLKENIKTFSEDRPLNEAEMSELLSMADSMAKGVPCTACHYCTSHCPQELDIPSLIKLYNEHTFTGGGFIAPMALSALPEDKQPSACIGCRSCEQVCPQQIKVSEIMADFAEKLKG